MSETTDIRTVVREKYGAIAQGAKVAPAVAAARSAAAAAATCCPDRLFQRAGGRDPAGADWARLRQPAPARRGEAGETVLDLGSGAGIDCFLAARETGPTGKVIGVDMTPP